MTVQVMIPSPPEPLCRSKYLPPLGRSSSGILWKASTVMNSTFLCTCAKDVLANLVPIGLAGASPMGSSYKNSPFASLCK